MTLVPTTLPLLAVHLNGDDAPTVLPVAGFDETGQPVTYTEIVTGTAPGGTLAGIVADQMNFSRAVGLSSFLAALDEDTRAKVSAALTGQAVAA